MAHPLAGIGAGVSGSGWRPVMQVEPTKLVELAASSELTLDAMLDDWASAVDELSGACDTLGDTVGAVNVRASYADSLTDAGAVVSALAEALGMGVAGLVDAAHDAVLADDAAASELARASHALGGSGFSATPGTGGR